MLVGIWMMRMRMCLRSFVRTDGMGFNVFLGRGRRSFLMGMWISQLAERCLVFSRWIRSGDIVTIDDKGNISIVDRSKVK